MTDEQISFDPRRAASIIKQHLVETLAKLQDKILRVERFGNDAVQLAMLGSLGRPDTLAELLADHAQKVKQIRALEEVLERASEAELMAFVNSRRQN